MANVLIMTPSSLYRRWPTTPDTTKMATNAAPVTMPQLAAALPKHNVKIHDGNAYDISLTEYAELLQWADIVAMNIMSSYAALNSELNIRFIKKIKPEIKVILGGHHATFQAQEWLSKGADVVVRREGEITLPEVVDALIEKKDLARVLGISWCLQGDIIHNQDRPFIENLDSLPLPRWDLMNFGKYYLYLRKKGYQACLETS
ncbi:MAG: cobalamin-dependent protein, partial [Elusimicrobiales bacterium]|nr:cobalamin-dependent protein [Elusimicrobiales bacterium]